MVCPQDDAASQPANTEPAPDATPHKQTFAERMTAIAERMDEAADHNTTVTGSPTRSQADEDYDQHEPATRTVSRSLHI